jgi:hypothetical protein
LLICLVVVGGAIAAVTALVTSGMPQPATQRRPPRRARAAARPSKAVKAAAAGAAAVQVAATPQRAGRRAARPEKRSAKRPAAGAATPATGARRRKGAEAYASRGRIEPATPPRWWQRLRSAVALVFLVAVLGLGAAATVGLTALLAALVLRRALG